MLPLTYHFALLLPSPVVLFHMPKHFNDIGFQAFSGLDGLMEQGSYRAKQSADFFFFFFSGRQNNERGKRKAIEDFEEPDKGHVLGLLRDFHYSPFSTEAMMKTKHFLSLKVAICPFNACVMQA